MINQLYSMWYQIDKYVDESPLLSMLVNENSISNIDYWRYLDLGYSRYDVDAGFELVQIYKALKGCLYPAW